MLYRVIQTKLLQEPLFAHCGGGGQAILEIAMNFHHLESGRSFVIELDELFVLCVNCKRTISKSPDMNSPADASHVVISSDLLLSLLERY